MFTVKEFLIEEVKPALGCTEPGAVALAVARAKEELSGDVTAMRIVVSDSIFKNGVAVGIPGTGGLKGNTIAAALASISGKSAYGLEVLKDISAEDIENAKKMVENKIIDLAADMDRHGVYVLAELKSASGSSSCVIDGTHTNIVLVTKDGKTTFEKNEEGAGQKDNPSVSSQISSMEYADLIAIADSMTSEDVDYAMNGVDMNMTIANYGLTHEVGICLGQTVRDMAGDNFDTDLAAQIRTYAAAASDARMDGAPLAVMSSAGSGNHGITAILPIAITGKYNGKTREEIAKAITISHMSTSFIKSRMGRLSPVCGCAVAAGAGSAAGLVQLMGGTVEQSTQAMELVLGNLIGMVCDGAKETCALKVSTGAAESYCAAMVVLGGRHLQGSQGIVDTSNIARTVENAVALNEQGMKDVDKVVIDVVSKRLA